MNDNGVKVTIPKQFQEVADKVLWNTLKKPPIHTESSIPGKVEMWFNLEGDLDTHVTTILTALTPMVLADFSVARF